MINKIRDAYKHEIKKGWPQETPSMWPMFEAGYKAGMPKWIPMSTPFPLDTPLLFLFESGGIICDIVTVSEAFIYFETKETGASGEIIAWMHAPEYPEWHK